MVVSMVQVIDHADVSDSLRLEPLDDGDLILGLAEPPAVVIKRERTADLAGVLGERTQLRHGRLDATLLLGPLVFVRSEIEQDPELGLDAVAFEDVENDPRFAVELAGGDPESVERDPARLSASISASNVGMCSARQS